MPRDHADARPRPDDRALARARGWARLLDDRFSVGGFRFGLDAVLGLIPGVGAIVTLAGGAVMLTSAWQLGLGSGVLARIVAYTALDAVIGAVPLIGDVFDFVFKAHRRSLRTIETALARRAGRAR